MPDTQNQFVMRLSRWIALLLLLVSAPAWAVKPASNQTSMQRSQKQESRREIDRLEEVWRKAVLTSNATVMETLLADDYIAISAAGTLQTKEQTLADMRNGRVHFSDLELSDRKVRFYGATALVTSRAEVKGVTDEGDVSGSHRYTRVYVRDKRGVWKIASFEVSPIGNSDDRK